MRYLFWSSLQCVDRGTKVVHFEIHVAEDNSYIICTVVESEIYVKEKIIVILFLQ
jgi:hypothetical protein